MGKSPEARSSAVQWDGAGYYTQVVGKTAVGEAATPDLGGFLAPCDLELVQVDLIRFAEIDEDVVLALGNATGGKQLINDLPIHGAAGIVRLDLTDALVLKTKVFAGEWVSWVLGLDATETDSVALTAVWVPAQAA